MLAEEDHSQHRKDPLLAECHGDVLVDLEQSVWDMLLGTATQHPDRDAVISLWQPTAHLGNIFGKKTRSLTLSSGSNEYLSWTYGQLVEAVELLAGYLQSKGCVEGENLVRLCSKPFRRRAITDTRNRLHFFGTL